MTSSALMRSFAFGVVTAMSGRAPVFMRLPWCQIHTGPLGRDCALGSLQEGDCRRDELVRALGHRDMSAPLQDPDLGVRKDLAHAVEVGHRDHAVFAAPDDQ